MAAFGLVHLTHDNTFANFDAKTRTMTSRMRTSTWQTSIALHQ